MVFCESLDLNPVSVGKDRFDEIREQGLVFRFLFPKYVKREFSVGHDEWVSRVRPIVQALIGWWLKKREEKR